MLAHKPLMQAEFVHATCPAPAETRALADKLRERSTAVASAENWLKLSVTARMFLVMAGAGEGVDVEYLARRDWGRFSEDDRRGMAAAHRRLRDEFVACGVLA